MNLEPDIKALLAQQIETLLLLAGHFEYTRSTLDYPSSLQRLNDPAVLEKYEVLTARFSRLQDWLIHPFRSIAILEFEQDKVERIPDLLNLMEKRGIVPDASVWREMRSTRNIIAHEYHQNKAVLRSLFDSVYIHGSTLLDITENTKTYISTVSILKN